MNRININIEWLPNGFIRVWDYACAWGGVYNADGSYRHGSARGYENAVKTWLATR